MKKLLLGTAAIAMGAAFAAPAQAADGVKLDLGGYFKGYVFYQDQDEVLATGDVRNVDALRQSEIHFSGETTLDNGLTVGAHFEMEADGNYVDGMFQESYAYFSGSWGRVNFGAEDGAAYLLQVAAPSADSNYDGLRQYVSPFNYGAGVAPLTGVNDTVFDYAQDQTGYKEKLTYLTPVMNGFQAGLSYSPEAVYTATGDTGLDTGYNGSFGSNLDNVADTFGSGYEAAVRYEGAFDEVGFTLGGGYTYIDLEKDSGAGLDDGKIWNVGLDVNFGPFGIGAVYTTDNQGRDNNADRDTFVVGADYTTGPFKLGASYLNTDEDTSATTDVETDRYTGGVVYTYGPGMTFRGALTYIEHDLPTGTADVDGTALMLGTQINF